MKRPEGYREPTEEEMQCLPEGTLTQLAGGQWVPTEKRSHKAINARYFAIPDNTQQSPPTAAPGIVRKAEMQTHDSGAIREDKTGRGAFHLIPPCAELALAKRFEDGAAVHGPNNWQKGLPLSTFYNSARRHMMQAAQGMTDEDHFGSALWNLSAWMWTAEEIKAGRLPAALNDLGYQQTQEVQP